MLHEYDRLLEPTDGHPAVLSAAKIDWLSKA